MAGISWRFVALLSILAMILSLLLGGLAGVPFGLLITRVVLAGLVFAVFAVIVSMIFFRFFPEIYSGGTDNFIELKDPESSDQDKQDIGKYVDMVTPDEKDDIPSQNISTDLSNKSKSPSAVETKEKEADEPQRKFDQDSGAMAQAIKTVMNRE